VDRRTVEFRHGSTDKLKQDIERLNQLGLVRIIDKKEQTGKTPNVFYETTEQGRKMHKLIMDQLYEEHAGAVAFRCFEGRPARERGPSLTTCEGLGGGQRSGRELLYAAPRRGERFAQLVDRRLQPPGAATRTPLAAFTVLCCPF
jgi:hypothetical protein